MTILDKINTNRNFKIVSFVILIIFCAGAYISFILTPFHNDLSVIFAAANQVQFQPDEGLLGIFESWEIKGIANRILIYIIYSISTVFTSFGTTNFIYFSTFIYSIFVILTLIISSLLFNNKRRNRLLFFLITFLSIFTTAMYNHLQVEMTTAVLSFLIFSLIIHDKKWSLITAGALCSLFFFFKPTLIFMLIPIICASYIFLYKSQNKKKKFILTLISFIISLIVLIIAVYLIYPQELKDVLLTAEFQSTIFSYDSNITLIGFLNTFITVYSQCAIGAPFYMFGAISAILLIVEYIKTKKYSFIGALIFMWMFAVFAVSAANDFSWYHYLSLLFPSVICVYLFLTIRPLAPSEFIISVLIALLGFIGLPILGMTDFFNYSSILIITCMLFIIMIVLYTVPSFRQYFSLSVILILSFGLFLWGNYSSILSTKVRNLRMLVSTYEPIIKNSFPEDFNEEPVLNLAFGDPMFYIDAPSYSRYFYNLPLQRWMPGDKEWDTQKSEYEKVLAYDGKYIIIEEWFYLDKYPELKKKLEEEYEIIENSGLAAYPSPQEYFTLTAIPDAEQIAKSSKRYILKRKNTD